MPLVSVITPSFEQARFLPATLESVAMQDYPRIEHIVMDGGSTDGSIEILRAWKRQHRIVFHTGPDRGQADAIAKGLALARGEILAWLNSDDIYLDPSAISDVVAAMAGGIPIVTGGGWYLHEDGTRMRPIPVRPGRLSFRYLRCVDWILQPATFFRRDLIERFPIDIALKYAFDWDLFVRISKDYDIMTLDRELAGYRLHDSGKSLSGGANRYDELVEVTRRYNGPHSPRYILIRAVAAIIRANERWPTRFQVDITHAISAFAAMTSRVTDGRGIQY